MSTFEPEGHLRLTAAVERCCDVWFQEEVEAVRLTADEEEALKRCD